MSADSPEDRPRLPQPLEWLFRDRRSGRITIVQFPNMPIIIFATAGVTRRLIDPSQPGDAILSAIATVSLLWWALDEMLRGVNPWRRLLGGAVLIVSAVQWVTGWPL